MKSWQRNRLRRGPKCTDRIPLGGGPIWSIAGAGGRVGSPPGSRDPRGRRARCGSGGQSRDHDDFPIVFGIGLDPVQAGRSMLDEHWSIRWWS